MDFNDKILDLTEQTYRSVGEKICKFAKCLGIFGTMILILAGIIWDIKFEIFGMTLLGIIIALLNIVSSWWLYAFGQITDDIHSMRYNLKHTIKILKSIYKEKVE